MLLELWCRNGHHLFVIMGLAFKSWSLVFSLFWDHQWCWGHCEKSLHVDSKNFPVGRGRRRVEWFHNDYVGYLEGKDYNCWRQKDICQEAETEELEHDGLLGNKELLIIFVGLWWWPSCGWILGEWCFL